MYAVVREPGSDPGGAGVTVCGGGADMGRRRIAYVTVDNSVEIRVVGAKASLSLTSFLLRFDGIRLIIYSLYIYIYIRFYC